METWNGQTVTRGEGDDHREKGKGLGKEHV